MFRQSVTQTALTSDAANSFFGTRIGGDAFGSDVSMLATLRALLYPRFREGSDDQVTLRIKTTTCNAEHLASRPAKDAMREIMSPYDLSASNQFIVHGFRGPGVEQTVAYMSLVDSEFAKVFRGYKPIDKVAAYYRKSFGVRCFVNEAKRNTILFVDGLDMRRLHYLQCCVLPAVPWYFDPANGLSDDERALVSSFREDAPDTYLACINKMAARYDFRSAAIRGMLSGVEDRFVRSERDDLARMIEQIDRRIRDMSAELGQKYREREDISIRLLGLEEAINRGDKHESELIDYFICNKHLVLDSVTGDRINFRTIADLTQFDPEMAETQIRNRNSLLYKRNGEERSVPYEDMKRLMSAIFLDGVLTVQFCASYWVDLRAQHADGVSSASFDEPEFINCMPNPHINGFGCIGNNRQAINRMLSSHNYMGAIDQCLASTSNLNFGDSTVLNRFINAVCNDVANGGRKCVRLPDGSYTDFRGALAFLKSGESANA